MRSRIKARVAAPVLLGVSLIAANASAESEKLALPRLLAGSPSASEVSAWATANKGEPFWQLIGPAKGHLGYMPEFVLEAAGYPIVRQMVKWERYLEGAPEEPRSFASEVTIDCDKKASKADKIVYFKGNNLTGPSEGYSYPDIGFDTATAGSVQEAYIEASCDLARRGQSLDKLKP